AQIREILISESAWEEMTCLFAPSLEVFAPLWSPYFIFSGGMAVMTQSIGHLIIFPQAKPFTTFFLPVSYLSGYSSYFLLFFFSERRWRKHLILKSFMFPES
ncbi:hypothetical protein M8R73_22515, partial [Enterobacter roggenkampii]|nr:hypothetical protein [Enterobacter roggenkampii]